MYIRSLKINYVSKSNFIYLKNDFPILCSIGQMEGMNINHRASRNGMDGSI